MHDETNGQTSNETELPAASEELHILSAESLDLVAGGPDGGIIIVGRT